LSTVLFFGSMLGSPLSSHRALPTAADVDAGPEATRLTAVTHAAPDTMITIAGEPERGCFMNDAGDDERMSQTIDLMLPEMDPEEESSSLSSTTTLTLEPRDDTWTTMYLEPYSYNEAMSRVSEATKADSDRGKLYEVHIKFEPEDISIVSESESPWCGCCSPTLSTVRHWKMVATCNGAKSVSGCGMLNLGGMCDDDFSVASQATMYSVRLTTVSIKEAPGIDLPKLCKEVGFDLESDKFVVVFDQEMQSQGYYVQFVDPTTLPLDVQHKFQHKDLEGIGLLLTREFIYLSKQDEYGDIQPIALFWYENPETIKVRKYIQFLIAAEDLREK